MAVKPHNKTLDKLWATYGNSKTLKSWKTFCSKLDVNIRTWLKALKKIEWPTDTAADAKALIKVAAAEDAYLRRCAKSNSMDSWQRAWDSSQKVDDRVSEAANLVRLDLGMNPVG